MKTVQNNWQKGQAGIVVLLVSVVMITVGLSIATRSVTDVRLSRQEEETTRAFDAAEAGVEDALRKNLKDIADTDSCGADCGAVTVPNVGGIPVSYQVQGENEMEVELLEGETVQIDLAGFSGSGVQVDWGRPDEICTGGGEDPKEAASLVVGVYDGANEEVKRYAVKGAGCGGNYFTEVGGASQAGYLYGATIPVNGDDEFLRIRSIYGPTLSGRKNQIMVTGVGGGLPRQFYRISSEASTTGGETRAVEVTRTIPGPLSIFDFAVFTTGTLIK